MNSTIESKQMETLNYIKIIDNGNYDYCVNKTVFPYQHQMLFKYKQIIIVWIGNNVEA